MRFEQISSELLLFFSLYGVTGVVPFIAAIYLLLRRGNAFAAEITPPLRLRRWAASFFGMVSLSHVWWMLVYVYSFHFLSVGYVAAVMLDCLSLLTTIAGTLLAMLQDRRRSVRPVFVGMLPVVVLGVVFMVWPNDVLMNIAFAYTVLFFMLFALYVAIAVRQYGRWLRDNFADLEHKEMWLTTLLSLVFMLLFIFYAVVDFSIGLMCFLHFTELTIFALLLWRVETLPTLQDQSLSSSDGDVNAHGESSPEVQPTPSSDEGCQCGADKITTKSDFTQIERQLAEHCVDTQLYLQHDLTLSQLAKAIGSNRTYLGQYFSSHGTTYNAYINDLRIRHFVSRCLEAVRNGQSVTAQQMASQSGYRSYSTFSLAFKQRMGQSATAWMREMGKYSSKT